MSFTVVQEQNVSPNDGREIWNDNFEIADRRLGAVVGGAGFQDVSGGVTLDLDATSASGGRMFHHTMTGNITSVTFANIPDGSKNVTEWVWVLRIDATGGYTISSTPTVDWRDKSDGFNNLDLSANAENTMFFRRVGSDTYGWLIDTGTVALSPLDFSFAGDDTQLKVFDRDYSVDLGNVQHRAQDGTSGDGSVSFEKNGSTASGLTTFGENDVLAVIRSGSSNPAAVSVPWYLA